VPTDLTHHLPSGEAYIEPEYQAWGTFAMFADPDGNEFGLTLNPLRDSVMQRIRPTALAPAKSVLCQHLDRSRMREVPG
jgi:hypothetical protein